MHDLRDLGLRFQLHEAATSRLVTEIDPADGMLPGNDVRQYFQVGASALTAIGNALTTAGKPHSEIRTVIDYACGYGRVLRWLLAEFPDAAVMGMDVDEKALESVRRILNVDTRRVQSDSPAPIGTRFDLIWVGSLFTHLPKDRSRHLLAYLADHLQPTGLLVFSAHGHYVADRIRSGKKLYRLHPDQAALLLQEYDDTGFGFSNYPRTSNYGIAVGTSRSYNEVIGGADMTAVLFQERMWANHHDVYAACPRDPGGMPGHHGFNTPGSK